MGIEGYISRLCVQTAVYWGSPAEDGYGGKTFADPVEISCRWENTLEVIRDAFGNEIVCRSGIYVTQDVEEQGYMYLGTLDDLDSDEEADPTTVDGAYEIRRFDKTPSLRATNDFLRKVYL